MSKVSYLFIGAKRIAKAEESSVSYYYTDYLGSTRIVDNGGQYSYNQNTPFGIDFGNASTERYKFTGKEDDGVTGLYYYNARYYDPGVGRFVGEDPAKDGTNWYIYTYNNLINYSDLDGLKVIYHPADETTEYLDYYLFTNLSFGVFEVGNSGFHVIREDALNGKQVYVQNTISGEKYDSILQLCMLDKEYGDKVNYYELTMPISMVSDLGFLSGLAKGLVAKGLNTLAIKAVENIIPKGPAVITNFSISTYVSIRSNKNNEKKFLGIIKALIPFKGTYDKWKFGQKYLNPLEHLEFIDIE